MIIWLNIVLTLLNQKLTSPSNRLISVIYTHLRKCKSLPFLDVSAIPSGKNMKVLDDSVTSKSVSVHKKTPIKSLSSTSTTKISDDEVEVVDDRPNKRRINELIEVSSYIFLSHSLLCKLQPPILTYNIPVSSDRTQNILSHQLSERESTLSRENETYKREHELLNFKLTEYVIF